RPSGSWGRAWRWARPQRTRSILRAASPSLRLIWMSCNGGCATTWSAPTRRSRPRNDLGWAHARRERKTLSTTTTGAAANAASSATSTTVLDKPAYQHYVLLMLFFGYVFNVID